MTTLRKVELESIFLISIVAAVSLFFVVQRNNQGLFTGSVTIPIVTPAPSQNVFSQISPDGTKKVIMRINSGENDTKTYSFYTADGLGRNEKYIFTRSLDVDSSMSVPFNTWSSNNQYFFIQENSPSEKSIFAFKANGDAFSDKEPYFDVTGLFKKRETGYIFNEATGWASESLIIINTKKDDGTKGPSYWFEVPSKAILILATEF